jgi:hypothetical protein
MSKIVWDQLGERLGETGVDQGVLFPFTGSAYETGVPWNGLTSVNEAPTGGEPNPFYADNQKYIEIMSEEEFAGTIGCYMYPDEFKAAIGETESTPGVIVGQQAHTIFGLSYRTKIVNDTNGVDHGFKIHLVYNALAGVTARDHTTMNESPELEELSFDFTTTKVAVTGGKPTSHLIIDSTKIAVEDAAKLQTLLDTLYGTNVAAPRLLMPDEVAAIFEGAEIEAITLSTIVPEDSGVNIAVNANITLTFNNKILDETISVLSAEGVVIAASHTFNATGKILTINPNVDLSLNTKYTVVVAGVVDIYGQALAPVTKSFTTVLE